MKAPTIPSHTTNNNGASEVLDGTKQLVDAGRWCTGKVLLGFGSMAGMMRWKSKREINYGGQAEVRRKMHPFI